MAPKRPEGEDPGKGRARKTGESSMRARKKAPPAGLPSGL